MYDVRAWVLQLESLYTLSDRAAENWIGNLVVTYKETYLARTTGVKMCHIFYGELFWEIGSQLFSTEYGFESRIWEYWSCPISSLLGNLIQWRDCDGLRSKNYGCYFQSFQQLSKAGFTVPGAGPASGQCEATLGVPRWPLVWGKLSRASSWISLLGNSSIDQVSGLMTCDGHDNRHGQNIFNRHWAEKESQHRQGYFDSYLSRTSFSTFIHLIQHIFTEQLLCARHCPKFWGIQWSMQTACPMGIIFWWRGCAHVGQRVGVFTPYQWRNFPSFL